MVTLQTLMKPFGSTVPSFANSRYRTLVWTLWLVMLLIVCIRVGVSPERQSSFSRDYAPAGAHWLHGEEVYLSQQSFLYSPMVAAGFAPFALLPSPLANIAWRIVSVAALATTSALWLRSGLSGFGKVLAPQMAFREVSTLFLLMLPLAGGNVNIGQINLLVLAFTTGAVLAVWTRRWNIAALLLAATAFMKIYPLAIGLLLVLFYPRQLLWRLVLALTGLFLLSLCLQRPAYVLDEYRHWFAAMSNDDRLEISLYATWRDFGFLLRACGIPLPTAVYRMLEVGAGGALALFLWIASRRQLWSEARLLSGIFSLGCAWMLLFGPATEAATYVVLSLPVCATLLSARETSGPVARLDMASIRILFIVTYVLLVVADLGNAWLHGMTHHLFIRALQPTGALIFTAGFIWWLLLAPRLDREIEKGET